MERYRKARKRNEKVSAGHSQCKQGKVGAQRAYEALVASPILEHGIPAPIRDIRSSAD